MDEAADLERLPAAVGAQLKGWFSRQPAHSVPASEHLTHGAKENEQLAALIGQLQHLIDLMECRFGRPRYLPVVMDVSGRVTNVFNPPSGVMRLDSVVLSTDTPIPSFAIALSAPSFPGGTYNVFQGSAPAGIAPSLPLNVLLPPDCTGVVVNLSAGPTHGYFVFMFSSVIPGGYPYVG